MEKKTTKVMSKVFEHMANSMKPSQLEEDKCSLPFWTYTPELPKEVYEKLKEE